MTGNGRATFLALALVALLAAAAIPAMPARAAAAPTLTVLSPANNAVIGNGSPVAVIFTVTDFNLTDPGTGGSSPGTGHVDVFVNGTLVAETAQNTVTLPLPSGPHTIRLELVNANESALVPDVSASISVMTTQGPVGGTPALSIPYPADGAVIGTDLWVSFRTTDFVLVPAGSPPGVPGEGHVHVILDGGVYAELFNDQPIHFNIPDGAHNVTLELVDSGSHPLTPDVRASVTFTVRALTGRTVRLDLTPYLAGANIALGLAVLAAIYRRLEA